MAHLFRRQNARKKIPDHKPRAVTVCQHQNTAGCGKAALEAGANAGALLKAISPIVGGGGGGRPDSATSGGRDVSRLDEALGAAAGLLATQLGAE